MSSDLDIRRFHWLWSTGECVCCWKKNVGGQWLSATTSLATMVKYTTFLFSLVSSDVQYRESNLDG